MDVVLNLRPLVESGVTKVVVRTESDINAGQIQWERLLRRPVIPDESLLDLIACIERTQ
jgi:hypothetical protein